MPFEKDMRNRQARLNDRAGIRFALLQFFVEGISVRAQPLAERVGDAAEDFLRRGRPLQVENLAVLDEMIKSVVDNLIALDRDFAKLRLQARPPQIRRDDPLDEIHQRTFATGAGANVHEIPHRRHQQKPARRQERNRPEHGDQLHDQ